jgi:hypothetical protein
MSYIVDEKEEEKTIEDLLKLILIELRNINIRLEDEYSSGVELNED